MPLSVWCNLSALHCTVLYTVQLMYLSPVIPKKHFDRVLINVLNPKPNLAQIHEDEDAICLPLINCFSKITISLWIWQTVSTRAQNAQLTLTMDSESVKLKNTNTLNRTLNINSGCCCWFLLFFNAWFVIVVHFFVLPLFKKKKKDCMIYLYHIGQYQIF